MKITIKSSILRDGLNKILTVIDRKNSRPILTNCLVSFGENKLELLATDLEVAAKINLFATTVGQSKFCINTKNLFDILRELPDADVSLEIVKDKNLLNLKCAKINYSLLITNSEEYPQVSFENSSETVKIKANDLQNIIQKTHHAISNDETRINLNGIYLQEIENKLRAVAIDGHRLALLDIYNFETKNQPLKDGVIIPKKGITELKKLADNYPDFEIELKLDDSFLYASFGNEYYLSIRLIAREYPKYQTVIPAKTSYTISIEKNSFLNAIKRIKLLSNEKTNGVKIKFTESELRVSADHPSLGHALELLPVSYTGPEMEIGFNARYMVDSLTTLDTQEVIFEFNNELSPVIIRSEEHENFLGIIMPLKI